MSAGLGRLRDALNELAQEGAYEPTRGLPGMEDPATQALKGYDYPPPFYHRNINVGDSANLVVGATRFEIAAYRIPAGELAAIRFIGNGLANISDSPFVTWSLTVDGADLVGYSNMVGLISSSITAPVAIALMLNPGQRIAWVATNTGATIVQGASALIRGWMWPPNLRP